MPELVKNALDTIESGKALIPTGNITKKRAMAYLSGFLYGCGWNFKQIATRLEITDRTIYNYKNELADEFGRGIEDGKKRVVQAIDEVIEGAERSTLEKLTEYADELISLLVTSMRGDSSLSSTQKWAASSLQNFIIAMAPKMIQQTITGQQEVEIAIEFGG